MKTFTFKDFLLTNTPCFACGKEINISFWSLKEGDLYATEIKPKILSNCFHLPMSITYHSTLILNIFFKDNKIETSNMSALTKYLQEHKLFLSCDCICSSIVASGSFSFSLEKKFIKPFETDIEYTYFIKENIKIYSFYSNNETFIYFYDKDRVNPEKIKTTLIPRYKFKNRDEMLSKIKLYCLFS